MSQKTTGVQNSPVQDSPDALKVRLLDGQHFGQPGEVVSLSASVARAAIAAGTAEVVVAEQAADDATTADETEGPR